MEDQRLRQIARDNPSVRENAAKNFTRLVDDLRARGVLEPPKYNLSHPMKTSEPPPNPIRPLRNLGA